MSQSRKINQMKAVIVLMLALVIFLAWGWYGTEWKANQCLYQHLLEVHQWLSSPVFGLETWDTKESWNRCREEIPESFAQWGSLEKESVFGDCHKLYQLMLGISQVEWEDENREAIVEKYMELTLSSHVDSRRNRSRVIIENGDVYHELTELLHKSD